MASHDEWFAHIHKVLPDTETATKYAAVFSKHCLPTTKDSTILAGIQDHHLKEMDVMIGHRGIIMNLFGDLRRGQDPLTFSDAARKVMADGKPSHAPDADGETHSHTSMIAISHAITAIDSMKKEVGKKESHKHYFKKPRVEYVSKSFGSQLKWVALFGERESEAALITEAKQLRTEFGFPLQFTERAFKDDGPMPFFLQEGHYAVILMRIPEEQSDDGTTIRTITNRVVLLFRDATPTEPPVIVTYHRFKNDAFRQMHSLWDKSLNHNTSSVTAAAKEFFKRLLNLYRDSISVLETRSEEAEADPQPEICIEKLSLIQKQSSVYARCLHSFEEVIRSSESFASFKEMSNEISEVASGLTAKAMELTENANTTINLKMALDAYRSGVNMKYFTYLSIVCQPVGVATGWFGMNWSNMPELMYEDSYFIFCGCVGAVLIGIMFSIWWFFERPRPKIALTSKK